MHRLFLLLVLAHLLAACHCGGDRTPGISSPVVLGYEAGRLQIQGRGFGAPGPSAELVLDGVRVGSEEPHVHWSDSLVELTLPAGVGSGSLSLRTASAETFTAALEVYRYQWFPAPATAGTNASPLALARDAKGALWVNEEFHLELKTLDPGAESLRAISIPRPPDPGPFAVYFEELFGVKDVDRRTQTSVLGESILVDPDGRIWFSQGGGSLYELTADGKRVHPNHSRIVRYDPGDPAAPFRVYNVPGDRNEVVGLAWDEARGRIWFAEGGRAGGGAITSFDPERVPWDNDFDFSTSLDALVNPANPEEGFRRFVLPDRKVYPAHLVIDSDGAVWYTAFLGNRVGRLDPGSGEIRELPLPPRKSVAPPAKIFDTGGPWEIELGPDGDIYFDESFDLSVSRIDSARVRRGDAACFRLGSEGNNPCIRELLVADPAVLTSDTDLIHSLAFDWDGRLWFGQHGPNAPGGPDTLGFVLPDLSAVAKLPPLRGPDEEPAVGVTGLAVDPVTRSIWFNEFWSKRLGRLTRVP